ncbi:MAG: NAD(P)/FAD-dependent oxidoreductase [Dehalococcoidia bacterium]|nr:NAD(P)/FAD-dependent oxidoreductase [Dehalococcoidia bacterium]
MADRHDVIVVGAGLGGVVCGALLAKSGLKVLVLDKNNRVGGKQMGISVRGFKGEMWPTYGIPVELGPFVDAFRQLGIESKLNIMLKTQALMYRRPGGEWVTMVNVAGKQEKDPTENMFNSWQLDAKEREVSLGVLAEMALLTPEQLYELDDVSVQQWLAQHENIPRPLRGFFAVHANLMSTGIYELVAMSELARIMVIFGSSTTGYPKGGYARLVEDIVGVLKANGGEVRTNARVERILVDDGSVTGVATKDRVYKAPIVVSNAGVHPTVLKLVGEEHFDKGYVNYVKDIVPSLGFASQRYIFSKPVMEHGVYIGTSEDSFLDSERLEKMAEGKFPEVLSFYGVVPSNFDPDMAPPGKQMLVLGTWCSPDPKAKEIKALQKKVDQQFEEMFPEAVPYIESREGYMGPAQVATLSRDPVLPGLGGEAVGLAVTVGYCGKNKPLAKSPISGLFYVGHDAGGRAFLGTHQAVSSGLMVAPLVQKYFIERKAVHRPQP